VTPLTKEQLDAIRQFDTCRIANAIETFDVRLRNEGYARPGMHWLFPSLAPMLGYAATSRVKTSDPPMRGRSYLDRTDWWREIASAPGPLIAVIQDIDDRHGLGAVAGETHSAILQRLGCEGLVTNGTVRDLPAIERMNFPMYACGVSPSRAYVHMVDHGVPVEIGGLQIQPGDLLYADRHGLISIPIEIAAELPAAAARQMEKDRGIVELCRSPDFSLERLEAAVR
jgi:4-hydroxy-4-methyl-2-oxoglutarate aldolase